MVQKSGINSPVEVGIISLSHYLQGLENIPGGCLGFLNHQQYHSHFICKIIMFQGLFEPPQLPTETSGQSAPKRRCILLNLRQGRAWSDETLANQRGRIPRYVRGVTELCKKQESFKNPSTTFNLVASIFVHVTCFLFLKLLEFDKSTPTVLS